MAVRIAVFDRHILSLDIAGFAQSLAERGHKRCRRRAGRVVAEEAVDVAALIIQFLAIGALAAHRPDRDRLVAGEDIVLPVPAHVRDLAEAAIRVPYSITSSARISIDCGRVRPSALAVLRLT